MHQNVTGQGVTFEMKLRPLIAIQEDKKGGKKKKKTIDPNTYKEVYPLTHGAWTKGQYICANVLHMFKNMP